MVTIFCKGPLESEICQSIDWSTKVSSQGSPPWYRCYSGNMYGVIAWASDPIHYPPVPVLWVVEEVCGGRGSSHTLGNLEVLIVDGPNQIWIPYVIRVAIWLCRFQIYAGHVFLSSGLDLDASVQSRANNV